jgi:hypothetical protein
LSQEAAKGKFVASGRNLSKKARLSVQAGDGQQRVWDEVREVNTINGVTFESGAFTGNYVEGDLVEKIEPYIKNLERAVSASQRIVGVVIAVNGKVEMVDVFESTPLFRKLWPKLLKGYALDAAVVAQEDDASKLCTVKDAQAFLDKARKADVKERDTKGGLVVTARSSDGVRSFSCDASDMDSMDGEAGGFGAGVHGAAY